MLPAFLIVLALLVGAAALTERGEEGPAKEPSAPLATVIERVEKLRGLRFQRDPRVERVTPRQATEEGLADLDRAYPAAAREADETLYAMLGLLPEDTDLRDVQASVMGEQVAGYYDPRTERLRLVEGAGTGNRVMDEVTLAHELVHALEDQAIGFDLDLADRSDDAGYAYRALLEGTATVLMFRYLDEYFASDVALGGLLGGAFAASSTTPLPPFVMNALTFPYVSGQAFVADLRAKGGDRLVDAALKARPPASTEQVLHPQKWIEAEPPLRVPPPAAPAGFRRLASGTFGEWQTGELLALAGGNVTAARGGWGGDRYALYGRGHRERVLHMHWRWDTLRDAREFAEALRDAAPTGRIRARGPDVRLEIRRS